MALAESQDAHENLEDPGQDKKDRTERAPQTSPSSFEITLGLIRPSYGTGNLDCLAVESKYGS